jgi:tripartite-type tricarboxylate transporter receptor subunit TctC
MRSRIELAGMPREIVNRLNTELQRTLGKPEIREKFAAMGSEVAPSTPDQMDQYARQQFESWRVKIQDAGIQPE